MGPLALGAKSLGMTVFGSDLHEGLVTKELRDNGIEVSIGEQDGEYLKKKVAEEGGVDWYVHTSAVRPGNKELAVAHELGLKVSKRDEFIEKIVDDCDFLISLCFRLRFKDDRRSRNAWQNYDYRWNSMVSSEARTSGKLVGRINAWLCGSWKVCAWGEVSNL